MQFQYDIHIFSNFCIWKDLILYNFKYYRYNKRTLVIKFHLHWVKNINNAMAIYIILNLNELKYISYIENLMV